MDSAMMSTKFTRLDFLRLQPVSSMPQQMIFSNTASTVDRAAKAMNRKNRVPHRRPSAMLAKMLGRVMKIRLGPLVWSTP